MELSRRSFFALVIAAVLAILAAVGTLAAPAAVLVDTSRSVPKARFEEAKKALSEMMPALAAQGPVCLYAFNDSPVKVTDFTTDASELQAGISRLEQGGDYTLLYDCVFFAVKALAEKKEPGVILLVTDGKDENSAVTLEDAASRAVEAHVGIVTAGLGSSLDLKALRRLATLTGGQYAGEIPGADLRQPFAQTASSLVPFPPPPAPPKPAPVQPPVQQPKPQAGNMTAILLVILAVLVVGLAVLAAIILRRTKKPEERACEECGHLLNIWETECPVCLAKKLAITNPGVSPQTPAAPPLPDIDPALMKKAPPSELLDHTMVLDEIPVLVLKRPGGPPRVFQLPPNQVVSVGRDKVNTIQVADQTLSGQHFRVIPKEGTYYVADLQSTNGTFLNGERVTLKELKPGSVIHVGQCEFTFRLEQKRLN